MWIPPTITTAGNRTIRTQRLEISFLLEDTPSLKAHWEASFTKAWSRALKIVRQDYPDTPFPDEWPLGWGGLSLKAGQD